jgi:hypothetical protein
MFQFYKIIHASTAEQEMESSVDFFVLFEQAYRSFIFSLDVFGSS